MRMPDVELLWWEGCPSTQPALEELREVLSDLGLDEVEVRMREIRTDDDARQAGFIGSPTVLVAGADVAPQPDEPAGLACRVYHRREGSISPTPDPMDVRDALRRAMAAEAA
jgi:glutaredoxin-related protein